MLKIFKCRRSSIALIGIVLIATLGLYLKIDTTGSIAMITMGIAAANASEAAVGKFGKKDQDSSSASVKD